MSLALALCWRSRRARARIFQRCCIIPFKKILKCFCISRASLKENNGLINTKQAAQRRCKQRLWFWIITILHRSEKHPPGYKKKPKKTSKLIIHKACCPTNQQLGLPLCAALLVEFPLVSQRQRLLSQKHREGVVFITPRDLASILPPGSARPGPARPGPMRINQEERDEHSRRHVFVTAQKWMEM